MELRDNQNCFVCGKDNPVGLKVEFDLDPAAKTIRGKYIPRPEHQGYEGIIHGGIIAALLDEAMVKLAWRLGIPAVSAELTTKFRAPAAPGDDLAVTARITSEHGRLIEAEAKVERGPVVVGEAKGKLLKVR
jgi:acyl-coenzyme A thioesterase PaaI-like protein